MDRIEQVIRLGSSQQGSRFEALASENARLVAQVESLKLAQGLHQQKLQESASRIKSLTAANSQLQELLDALQLKHSSTLKRDANVHEEKSRLADELQEWRARALEAEEQAKANQELIDATVRIADSILNKSARLQALEGSHHSHRDGDSSFADFDPADAPVVGSFDIVRTPPKREGSHHHVKK